MATTFPTSIQALPNPAPGTLEDALGYSHADAHATAGDTLEAIQAKLGTGATTPAGFPGVLRASGSGSAWGTLQTGDIAPNAVSQVGVAYGVATTTHNSPSAANVADLAVTLSTTGGDLLCWIFMTISVNAVPDVITLSLGLDGAYNSSLAVSSGIVANMHHTLAGFRRLTGISAASHTVRAMWSSQNSNTITSLNTFRQLVVMELKR